MNITWHGKPGWKNKGYELEYGQSVETHIHYGCEQPRYYFSLCGPCDRSQHCEYCKDDPKFHLFAYCEKGWCHVGDGDSISEVKALLDSWVPPE